MNRAGTTAVEFALTFPIVLGVFMAMIFFSQAYLIKSTAEMAAYAGAREGILVGARDQEIELAASKIVSTVARNFEIDIDRTSNYVDVTVTVPMDGNSWATGHWCPESVIVTNHCRLKLQ